MVVNNCTEENKIEWNNVFMLNEFRQYLDIKSLAEFSLVSKFNRNKLKSRLFSFSALIEENYFSFIKCNLSEYEGRVYFSEISYSECFWDIDKLNIELTQQSINISEALSLKSRLINDSRRIEPFIKSLRFQNLGHLLYVLYPVTFAFTNLTQLEIESCTFPLLTLVKIGENLKNLKIFALNKVLLIEFDKQELTSSLPYFPISLEELKLNLYCIINFNPKSCNFHVDINQNYNEGIDSICFEQLKPSSLKRLTIFFINPIHIRSLLNLHPNVEEISIADSDLDQKIIDKLSTMQSLAKLYIYTTGLESLIITSHSEFKLPQFNFIKNLELEFSESMYKTSNEFLNFTNHFPNLTRLSIDLTGLNFENVDIGKFFLETLPSYKKLEILTLVYMECKDEYDFNWLSFINVKCLILDFDFVDPEEIDLSLISYKVSEIRKRACYIKLDLESIMYNPELFDEWKIKAKGEYIYFNR